MNKYTEPLKESWEDRNQQSIQKMVTRVHHKEDFIKFHSPKLMGGVFHRCICADDEFAVFAPVSKKRDGGYRTHLSKLWCCGQNEDTSVHDFERIYRGDFTVNFPVKVKTSN